MSVHTPTITTTTVIAVPLVDLAGIAALRARAWANGWRVLSVLPWDFPDPEQAGKAPLGNEWQKRARQDPPECTTLPAVAHAPNTGIMTDGKRGVDIDIDDPAVADAVQALAFKMLGATICRTRDNSSRRLLPYRAAEGSPPKRSITGLGHSKEHACKIEVLGHGQQFVAFGMHPTGVELKWYPACPAKRKISEIPAVTEEQITNFLAAAAPLIGAEPRAATPKPNGKSHQPRPDTGTDKGTDDGTADIRDVVAALAVIPNDDPADWEHWNAVGMAAWVATDGSKPGFNAWAKWSEKHPEHDAEACAKRWHHYPQSPPDRTGAGKLFKMARAAQPDWQKPSGGWQNYLQFADGMPIPNLANAALALRQAPELKGIMAYDQMLRLTLVIRSLPGSRVAPVSVPRPVKDTDVAAIQEWMQRHNIRRIGKDTVYQAVDLVAQEHAFHPVRNYLNGLRWDGERRLGGWLNAYLGVEHGDYARAVGTMFMVSMVARVFEPGCKVDYMLVLEGPQGVLKSTICAILAGEWFSDSLPELHHGDAVRVSMHLRGKWLIEIAELSSFNKAEAGSLKAFLTQRKEQYTPKYARCEVVEERQCVFIGTTNKHAYLRDETGGRRFWPAVVGIIDPEGLARDRDQLFAEAVQLYRSDAQWWPSKEFEGEHIRPVQDARFEADAWEGPISTFLSGKTETTVMEIAREGLFIDTGRVGTADQRRIIAVLEREGWVRGKKITKGVPWFPPSPQPRPLR